MNKILLDTGYLYALYTPGDDYYSRAAELCELLNVGTIIIPYPVLYETINTKFAKNKNGIIMLKAILNKSSTIRVDDTKYREKALELTLEYAVDKNRALSLVDMIIRLMLEDTNLKIDALFTFNPGDFYDVCTNCRIELIS